MTGQEKTYHLRSKHGKAEVAVIISEKINFKNITKNNEEHFKIIKGSVHQKGIVIINIHVPSNRSLKYMSQKLTR